MMAPARLAGMSLFRSRISGGGRIVGQRRPGVPARPGEEAAADFVGRHVPSEPDDHVGVELTEEGHPQDQVSISRPTNRRSSDEEAP